MQSPQIEQSTDEIKQGIDILSEMRLADIVFTGGNPLLRNDIEEILKYAHGKFPLVTIYDNGSMIEKRLSALKYADKVCVSLSSLNSEQQSNLCGVPKALENSLKSLDVLEENNISSAASILISNENLPEVPSIIEYFGSRGISVNLSLYDSLSLPDSPIKIGKDDSAFHIKEYEMIEFISILRDLRNKYRIYTDLKTIDSVEKIFIQNIRDWKCQALSSFFTIDERGYVSGCHIYPPVCHLFKLQELWETPKFRKHRSQYYKCEKCGYLCYISYSKLRRIRDLIEYTLDYALHSIHKYT